MEVDLDFLGPWPFRCECRARRPWIFLDFLGFSRQNRDFSMGYAGFVGNNFFVRLGPDVSSATTVSLAFGMQKGVVAHGLKLTAISAFLQAIVVDRSLI
jgi:hypothetical protein